MCNRRPVLLSDITGHTNTRRPRCDSMPQRDPAQNAAQLARQSTSPLPSRSPANTEVAPITVAMADKKLAACTACVFVPDDAGGLAIDVKGRR